MTGKLFVRLKRRKKKAFVFLMIRAGANVTKLASVIDKPRSYFRPETHQIECVIKGEQAETERWMDASCD